MYYTRQQQSALQHTKSERHGQSQEKENKLNAFDLDMVKGNKAVDT